MTHTAALMASEDHDFGLIALDPAGRRIAQEVAYTDRVTIFLRCPLTDTVLETLTFHAADEHLESAPPWRAKEDR